MYTTRRFLTAQVMNIGIYDDICELTQLYSSDVLADVLRKAEAGQFSERSWHYWHYRLGLARNEQDMPPYPSRRVFNEK